MLIDASCANCVFFKLVSEMLFYRCSRGIRRGEYTPIAPAYVCRYWRPSVKDMDVRIAREVKDV